MTQRPRLATGLLVLAAVIWGFAFVAQRAAMEHVGPFTFNGVRFVLGALVLTPILAIRRRRRPDAGTTRVTAGKLVLGCGLAGVVLFGAASLQQLGIVYTTAGKAGFITGLYVVMVPLLGRLRGQRLRRTVWIATLCAVAGLYLLSVHGTLRVELGDGLVLAGALGWAIHVHLIGWLAARARPLVVAVVQFAVCGVLSLVIGFSIETVAWSGVVGAGWSIAYAGVLSTGVAYTLQVVGQRHVDPTRAGIVLSLEAMFAVLGGWLLLGEGMTARMLGGCALMFVAMLLSQLGRTSSQALVGPGEHSAGRS